MISVRDLSYRYEGNACDTLSHVNLEFPEGRLTAVMGANGSGKSTLARTLNGLLQPTSGDVLVDGLNTRNRETLMEIRRKVGFVFQDPNLQMTSATVERELAFGLQNVGLPTETIHGRVESELHRLNLIDRRNDPPLKLSGGEKQRLALAAVLLLEPNYLVCDEPTSFLSRSSGQKVIDNVFGLRASHGATIILVTQFLSEALQADRLIVLDKSGIAFDDNPRAIGQRLDFLSSIGIVVPRNIHSLL